MFRWIRVKEGGSLRMYMKFREQMFQKNFEPLAHKVSPVCLWDLSRHDDAIDAALASESDRNEGWRISDDGVIGGYSRGKLAMIRTSEDYKRWVAGEELTDAFRDFEAERKAREQEVTEEGKERKEQEGTETNANATSDQVKDIDFDRGFTPFLRWTGNIDTTVGLTSDAQRSGFAAIRSTEYPYGGANLQGLFNALEIICRTDGRFYTVNLSVSSFFPGDLYQGYINVPPTHPDRSRICPNTGGEFERLILPFTKFVLTAHGRHRDRQRTLDNNVEVQHVGFTLMDGKDGKFQFDLARIRAVNFDGHNIQGEEQGGPVKIAR